MVMQQQDGESSNCKAKLQPPFAMLGRDGMQISIRS
jgi:hypothetical protein